VVKRGGIACRKIDIYLEIKSTAGQAYVVIDPESLRK
jgi:hypothetical protein